MLLWVGLFLYPLRILEGDGIIGAEPLEVRWLDGRKLER